jgi:hypothetical protein
MGSINRKINAQASLDIKARPYLKNNQHKKDWRGVAQGIKCLSSNHRLWIQFPPKKKKEREK